MEDINEVKSQTGLASQKFIDKKGFNKGRSQSVNKSQRAKNICIDAILRKLDHHKSNQRNKSYSLQDVVLLQSSEKFFVDHITNAMILQRMKIEKPSFIESILRRKLPNIGHVLRVSSGEKLQCIHCLCHCFE